jgi:CPA2 family monovalent cation:H+ antiporter-2
MPGQVSILQISISIGIVAAFVGSLLIFGSKFIPNIIDKVGKTNDYALLLIVILGLAFGLSFVAKELGLSVATGAFLAGVLVAESKSAAVAKVVTIPPSKFLIITGVLVRSKYDAITVIRTGFGMSSTRGELSLVVVKGGQDVGAISSSIFPIVGVVTIITTFMAPHILRFGSKLKLSSSSSFSSSSTNNSQDDNDSKP